MHNLPFGGKSLTFIYRPIIGWLRRRSNPCVYIFELFEAGSTAFACTTSSSYSLSWRWTSSCVMNCSNYVRSSRIAGTLFKSTSHRSSSDPSYLTTVSRHIVTIGIVRACLPNSTPSRTYSFRGWSYTVINGYNSLKDGCTPWWGGFSIIGQCTKPSCFLVV